MASKLLALLLLAGITSIFLYSTSHQKSNIKFDHWATIHAKVYDSEVERNYREKIFNENLAMIQAHNADETQNYTRGINQFSDLTQEEFAAKYLTLRVNHRFDQGVSQRGSIGAENVDWNAKGMVSPVKNQANCGSCWAFSAIAAIESLYRLNGQTLSFSEQQLVDCSGPYGNQGCNGGWMDSAFQYVIDHGIASGESYPYTARTESCKVDSGNYKISGFVDVQGCDNLQNALARQPVSVAVDASVWSSYRSGVLDRCGTSVNHGVLAVGLSDNFWLIKNSWGTGWGESGFIRIARGNTCAVCSFPSYPTL